MQAIRGNRARPSRHLRVPPGQRKVHEEWPVGERNRCSVRRSWHYVQHDAVGSLYVGQKSRETEDSSTGSALTGWKFHLCNAGNARSNAIPEGLVTRDPPPISCSLHYPTKTERRHIILSKIFCILINSLLGNVFDLVFWSNRKVILLNCMYINIYIYMYIYIFICMYIYIYIYIYICVCVCMYVYICCSRGKKTERLYFHPYKPVSWLLTNQGIPLESQACRDESIVSLFFFPIATYITLYFYVSSTVKQTN